MIDRSTSAEQATVLLVEPSDEIARLMADELATEYSNTTLHTVGGNDDALEYLHRRGEDAGSQAPCLVVLRYDRGPNPSGAQVLETMREETALARIPVVATVDSPTRTTVHEAYRLGANAVVPIPSDPDALVETMQPVVRFWIATARLPNRVDRL
ncbi:response regulator [Natronorubrum halophilum]|uniref:response regulator n=1 Tax=Natronorubrum halophilum TaxID=1702106 RepID=UPI0010C1948B|nr:response regulator [Natronorubrum halophilum]